MDISVVGSHRLIIAIMLGSAMALSAAILDIESSDGAVQHYGLGCLPDNVTATSNTSFNSDPPDSFDWRNVDGKNYVTSVKDQGQCGSCVAFATVGAFESIIKITEDNTVDLSEAHLYFCNGRVCTESEDPNKYGWYISGALNYIEKTGIPDELCFPYKDSTQPCNPCDDWEQRIYRIKNWERVSGLYNIKNALVNYGPLVTRFDVYSDFYSYTGGIYEHTSGSYQGGHAVCVVGYNDNPGYWICKNSWGKNWGLNGYFKIKYGEVGIDEGMYYLEYQPIFRANIYAPSTAKPGKIINFTGSASGGKEPYSWDWDFGDGATSTEKNPQHVYEHVGIYRVTLTVTDSSSQKTSAYKTITVNSPPSEPIIQGPSSGKYNTKLFYTFRSSDDDGHQLKYFVKWGDGKGSVSEYVETNTTVELGHYYLTSGTYTIEAYAEDEMGKQSTISEWSVEIFDSYPPETPSDPYPADGATRVPLNVVLTWNCSDRDSDDLFFDVYFGESGNMRKIANHINTSVKSVSGLKRYTTYAWRIIAFDSSGIYTKGPIWYFTTVDSMPPGISIQTPAPHRLYFHNRSIIYFKTMVIGSIKVEVKAYDQQSGMHHVDFFVDDIYMASDDVPPYSWIWDEDTLYDTHELMVVAYDNENNTAFATQKVTVINLF